MSGLRGTNEGFEEKANSFCRRSVPVLPPPAQQMTDLRVLAIAPHGSELRMAHILPYSLSERVGRGLPWASTWYAPVDRRRDPAAARCEGAPVARIKYVLSISTSLIIFSSTTDSVSF